MAVSKVQKSNGSDAGSQEAKELDSEITFWHSLQGAEIEGLPPAADNFMQENPKVKINIEILMGDFCTKWTTGLASKYSGYSTYQIYIVEMMDSEGDNSG